MNLTTMERKWIKLMRGWRNKRRQIRDSSAALSEAAVKWVIRLLWRLS
jgi:hypothetical protein